MKARNSFLDISLAVSDVSFHSVLSPPVPGYRINDSFSCLKNYRLQSGIRLTCVHVSVMFNAMDFKCFAVIISAYSIDFYCDIWHNKRKILGVGA